ncbi:MAG TPA: acyl-CoA dehydrogenase family protein [Acidimicrobiia bacterium]|jgi:alkylation response protein AidB-like acyl-CoA dehydrogenase|nr:acyl-CoA dehydrogenase family protein [Acidimicrobiia bacterium]
MDLELSDDQELFRETTARFVDARCPLPRVRELADTAVAHDPALLGEAGELGWFALFVPEEHGGGTVSGSPVRDAVIVAEERGRFVQPGPFVATNVVAFALAREGSADEQASRLPDLASGARTASWAFTARNGVPEVGAVRATRSGDGYTLDGVAGLVPEGPSADFFLVSAADAGGEGGVTQFVVDADAPGVTVTGLEGLDLTRRFADVRFDSVSVPATAVLGTPGAAQGSVDAQLDVAVALTLAESIGAMRQLAEITVDYAKARIAFGRPIGSFQALKHILADISFWAEVSAAGATAAADAVADARPTASEIASIAKAYTGDAGAQLAQQCLQVHGGIGFTWEHDLHFYLRRLAADRVLYGDPDWHRERICRIHGLEGTAK